MLMMTTCRSFRNQAGQFSASCGVCISGWHSSPLSQCLPRSWCPPVHACFDDNWWSGSGPLWTSSIHHFFEKASLKSKFVHALRARKQVSSIWLGILYMSLYTYLQACFMAAKEHWRIIKSWDCVYPHSSWIRQSRSELTCLTWARHHEEWRYDREFIKEIWTVTFLFCASIADWKGKHWQYKCRVEANMIQLCYWQVIWLPQCMIWTIRYGT